MILARSPNSNVLLEPIATNTRLESLKFFLPYFISLARLAIYYYTFKLYLVSIFLPQIPMENRNILDSISVAHQGDSAAAE